MNSTYTISEGQDALSRALLMMHYDLGKTLSENVILEQPDEKFDTPYNKSLQRKYNTSTTKINGASVSDVLLSARELLFTPGGMIGQVVISILGAEIGAPIAFEILDIAIIINDMSIMVKNWKTTNYTPWTWEWFNYHYDNNKGFHLILEDISILVGMGVIKFAGIGAKAAWKIFKPISKDAVKMINTVEQEIIKKTPYIKKLPKKIASFAESKIGEFKKGIELLKSPQSAIKSVKKQIPTAIISGGLTYGYLTFFDKFILPKITSNNSETIDLSLSEQENKALIESLLWNNSEYFPNGIKKIQIVTGKNKKMGYFKIDGNVYSLVDPKTYKLKLEKI